MQSGTSRDSLQQADFPLNSWETWTELGPSHIWLWSHARKSQQQFALSLQLACVQHRRVKLWNSASSYRHLSNPGIRLR